MSLISLQRRLRILERKLHTDADCTLEALCRVMWDRDAEGFKQLAQGRSLRIMVSQFEAEDAERERQRQRDRPTGAQT